ncbi:MAG: hypothetical protein KAS15_04180 [Nanoarchaeota archaeon]|nr:hypothetical protein [Nanoarchaeota archaeon]MCK5630060.1 hypothetical protein [Nanoarchaeota archaeon]
MTIIIGILLILAIIASLWCFQNKFPLKWTCLACAMWAGFAFFRPRALILIALLIIGYIYQRITQNNEVKKVDEVDEEINEEVIFKD